MHSKFSVAVIVTTYNRPDALLATLKALARQRRAPEEIIVADDGSTAETAEVIKSWSKPQGVRVKHLWHDDLGFRAAAIRNRATAHCSSSYLIFIDGDCVVRDNFVEQHCALAEEARFVAGNRILLSPTFTEFVLRDSIELSQSTWTQRIRYRLRGDINRLLPLIGLPGGVWRRWADTRWEGAKTANLAMWRENLMRVNGFDESFEGWGFEDSDLVIRLIRAGIRRTDGRFATGVFHLWHRENDRGRLARNLQLLESVRTASYVRAKVGIAEAADKIVRCVDFYLC